MSDMNVIVLMGRLCADPQMSYLPSNTPVTELRMASNRKYKKKDGQLVEDTCFCDLRAYGNQAETLSKYCEKGSRLLVSGRLHFDQWEGKDGQKRSKHLIIVESFTFLDSKSEAPKAAQPAPQAAPAPDEAGGGDLPF